MRPIVPVAILLGVLLAIPQTATAAPATLTLEPRARVVELAEGEARAFAITVELTLRGFTCLGEARFPVALEADTRGEGAAAVTADVPAEAVFVVPAGVYLLGSYRAEQRVEGTLHGLAGGDAQVRLVARLANGGGAPCLAPGGYGQAEANATVDVRVLPRASGGAASPEASPSDASARQSGGGVGRADASWGDGSEGSAVAGADGANGGDAGGEDGDVGGEGGEPREDPVAPPEGREVPGGGDGSSAAGGDEPHPWRPDEGRPWAWVTNETTRDAVEARPRQVPGVGAAWAVGAALAAVSLAGRRVAVP